MKQSPHTRFVAARIGMVLVLLQCIGAVSIVVAGGGSTKIFEPLAASTSLAGPEQAYVDYVGPRLQELVDEMTQVTALVQARSRNVIKLNTHGVRISTLSSEITEYGDENGIPVRFASVDAEIRQGCGLATATVQRARQSLLAFDFSTIPALIPEFAEGREKLSSGLADLRRLADPVPIHGVRLRQHLTGTRM